MVNVTYIDIQETMEFLKILISSGKMLSVKILDTYYLSVFTNQVSHKNDSSSKRFIGRTFG